MRHKFTKINFLSPFLGSSFVVLVAAISMVGCGPRYQFHPTTEFEPAERPRDREMPIYTTLAPRDGLPVGLLQSRVCEEKNYKNLERQLEDIRRGALAVNADAVVELQVLPVGHRGWTADPQSPIPSWKHGRWVEYVVRGTAIIYPDREELLRPEEPEEAEGEAEGEEGTADEEAGVPTEQLLDDLLQQEPSVPEA